MFRNRTSKMLLVGAALNALTFGTACAGLNIDVRATSVIGTGSVVNGKLVENVQVGSVVNFDIFAVVVGTNASTADDKFISASGSWVSSNGGLLGSLQAGVVRTSEEGGQNGFDNNGFSVGLQQDLDGDGDIDVGSNVDSHANNYWAARFIQAPNGSSAGSTSPTSNGRRIGFGTFTVTSESSGSITHINFRARNATVAATYIQDNVTIMQASTNGVLPLVINSVPESVTLGFAGLAGLALLRRRKR